MFDTCQSLPGLLGEGGDQTRMGVSERVDRDARAKIQISLAIAGERIGALPPLEAEVGSIVNL